jgi:hypothetical protein
MAGTFMKVCVGVIALCKVMDVLMSLIRYAKDYPEEEIDEPIPDGMYS